MENADGVIIRKARREDCEAIMDLKIELADHQDMGGRPMLSVQGSQQFILVHFPLIIINH